MIVHFSFLMLSNICLILNIREMLMLGYLLISKFVEGSSKDRFFFSDGLDIMLIY
jgi:hypothetical protein